MKKGSKAWLESALRNVEHTNKELHRQVEQLGNKLAQTTTLVQTQDGEIDRLTALNDRLFRIIDKMITGEEV